jgi:transcriptional regulator with XRE-family HTH domain
MAAAKTRLRMSAQEKRLRVVLGRNVRALREEQGLTLEAVASTAGIGARTWQKIEAGDVGVTLKMVSKLAIALDVDPLVLFAPP